MLLLRPLFFTSWLLDDFLAGHAFFGANHVILSSASSKTSIGLAHMLKRQRPGITTIGLTSAANQAMVSNLGLYTSVVTYDDLLSGASGLGGGSVGGDGGVGGGVGGGDEGAASSGGAVLVDMAGNGKVISAVHHALGEQLRHSCMVGLSHAEAAAEAGGKPPDGLPGPKPKFFFAPAWVKKRAAEFSGGVPELLGEILPAWDRFVAESEAWMRISRLSGADAVMRGYAEAARGETSPSVGVIMSLPTHECAGHPSGSS